MTIYTIFSATLKFIAQKQKERETETRNETSPKNRKMIFKSQEAKFHWQNKTKPKKYEKKIIHNIATIKQTVFKSKLLFLFQSAFVFVGNEEAQWDEESAKLKLYVTYMTKRIKPEKKRRFTLP